MEFHVLMLGTVELHYGERRSSLGSAKERLVLAALAWDVGQLLSAETLIHRVWDDAPPPSAREGIRTYVSRIGRRMRALTDSPTSTVRGRMHTYTLDADPETIDARRYLSMTEQARAFTDSGSVGEATKLLGEATRLWRGDPLAGLKGRWPERVRATLREKRLGVLLLRSRISLLRGEFNEVIGELEPLADARPEDEALVEHLALALLGAGRALQVERLLRRTERALIEDLGTDLGERLLRVRAAVRDRTPLSELLAALGHGPQPSLRISPAVSNLPSDTDWVGRRDEIDKLLAMIKGSGKQRPSSVLVSAIGGMGGVGKTALAVHIAHQVKASFPDGHIMIDLRGYDAHQKPLDTTRALTELLHLLGLSAQQIPADQAQLTATWRSVLSSRRALVILDNASGPEQVSPLLPGASESLLIITSRRHLAAVSVARPLSLDTLSDRDSIELFQDRVGPDREPSPREAAKIAQLCGNLPLAVEIAASRFLTHSSWSVDDLVQQLDRASGRTRELHDGTRDIEKVFALSVQDLSPEERRLFRRLGLHIGPAFGPHAAAVLADLPVELTERSLEKLLHAHLLNEPGSHRYRLHDLLADYARTLVAAEESQDAVARLLDAYLHVADRADRLAFPYRCRIAVPESDHPAPPAGWLDETDANGWFMSESSNLLAILEYLRSRGDHGRSALLVHVLGGFLTTQGYLATARPYVAEAVDYWHGAGDGHAETRALIDLATLGTHAGESQEAVSAADTALALARMRGDREAEAEAVYQLGFSYYSSGRNREALPIQERAVELAMRLPDTLRQARGHNLLGVIHLGLGNLNEASISFNAFLEGSLAAGYKRGVVAALQNLAELFRTRQEYEKALDYFRKAMALEPESTRLDRATLRLNIAHTLLDAGDLSASLDGYREVLPMLRYMEFKRGECAALNGIGRALQKLGRHEEAIPQHMASLALARQINASKEEAGALRGLGLGALARGQREQAVGYLEEALTLLRRLGARAEEAEVSRLLTEAEYSGITLPSGRG
ncbi:AfsR/SARP family transcriptional regulator [Streptomyces profundus]|uniref:AfsR/SARP family transcriptional regulator n=1 Tax=Streptomyces profundus TaxID=2867410 RepID=UPI001D16D1E7|nr:tetratricopeptide repeat protein [Streptomyces sp. MA3_2.13]UED86148.1 tetratricopeptide repeat protein [Streptomyces sp. MA3_2.13]